MSELGGRLADVLRAIGHHRLGEDANDRRDDVQAIVVEAIEDLERDGADLAADIYDSLEHVCLCVGDLIPWEEVTEVLVEEIRDHLDEGP